MGLALRLAHLLTVRDSPFFTMLYIDPLWYDEWGLRIAAGQLLAERPFFLDPLYPYFLGLVYTVFGHHYEAVAAIQGLLGACVAPLVMLASLRWFDRPSARAAGAMAVVYLPSVYFGGLLMKPAITLFLVAMTLWLLSRALAGGSGRWIWPAAGVAFALACLTRGNMLLLLPFLVPWIGLRADPGDSTPPASRAGNRAHWVQAGGFALGAAVVLGLPAAHNYAVGDELILTTANAGANFYIGNNPSNDSGEYQQLDFVNANPKYEQRDFAAEARRRTGVDMTDREISRFWFRESRKWIRAEPLDWAGLMWRKLRSFWGAFEIPDSLDYYLYRSRAPLLNLPIPGFGLLAPLGLLGAVLSITRRGWPRLLLLFTVVYTLSTVVFFVFSRFRMVIVPALFVFAGVAAVECVRRASVFVRDRSAWRPVAIAAAWFLVFATFVNLPVRAMVDGWAYPLARAAGLPARPESSVTGLRNLGVAYAGRAKAADDPRPLLELAEAELRAALALDPPYAVTHIELGKVLARQKRTRDAIEVYEQARAIEPQDYKIHHALGLLHRRLGEPEAAERGFRRALELARGHAASAIELGQVLLEAGRRDEAAQLFEYALRLSPGNRAAQEGLDAARSNGSAGGG